jgi:hypothetical protein
MNTGPKRYLRTGGHGKIGRVQRQCLRVARLRDTVTTLDLIEWTFPRVRPEDRRHWHWESTRRAARRFWTCVGRAGRYLVWAPKDPLVTKKDCTTKI